MKLVSKDRPVSVPDSVQIPLRFLKLMSYFAVILGLMMPIYSWEDPPGAGKSFISIFMYRHCFLGADKVSQREVTFVHDGFVIGNHTCLEFDLWDDAGNHPQLEKHSNECRTMQRSLRAAFFFVIGGLGATVLSTFSVEHRFHSMVRWWPPLLKGRQSGVVWNGLACGLYTVAITAMLIGPRPFLDASTENMESIDAAVVCFVSALVTGLGCICCLFQLPPDSVVVVRVDEPYREGQASGLWTGAGQEEAEEQGRDGTSTLVKQKIRGMPSGESVRAEVVLV